MMLFIMSAESDEKEEVTATKEFRTHKEDLSLSEPKEAAAAGKMVIENVAMLLHFRCFGFFSY